MSSSFIAYVKNSNKFCNNFHFLGENKFTICRHLNSKDRPDPIEVLEQWWHNDEYIKREIGFCAVWCLDNLCELEHE